jgi:hypothetical protein
MSKIEARNLGDSGRAYLRRQLTGVNGFCSELLAAINAVPGEVLTFAPSETTLERLLRFEEGGLLPENLTGLDVDRQAGRDHQGSNDHCERCLHC